jgi:Rrf2 family iron-sulfur cluster assembly transcriptional regulator
VTHDLWEELGRQIHIFLSGVTLADVVNKRVLGMSKPIDTSPATGSSHQTAAE